MLTYIHLAGSRSSLRAQHALHDAGEALLVQVCLAGSTAFILHAHSPGAPSALHSPEDVYYLICERSPAGLCVGRPDVWHRLTSTLLAPRPCRQPVGSPSAIAV